MRCFGKIKSMKHKTRNYLILIFFGAIACMLFFFVSRFTTINNPFYGTPANGIPDLSVPIKGKSFEIHKIIGGSWNEIRYDPMNNFYIVATDKKIIKINSRGDISFVLDLNDRDFHGNPDFMEYHRRSHFVMSWNGIYDLSKENLVFQVFEKQLNTDGEMEWDEWVENFKDLYKKSENVLWGYKKAALNVGVKPLYFNRNGKWIVLYTLKNVSQINLAKTFARFRLNYKEDFIPDKFNKLYLLKDIEKKGAYSDYNNFDQTYNNDAYLENNMQYEKKVSIETISFKKEVYNEVPYTLIPSEFSGTAVNKLHIGNDNLIFKTKAIKRAGFGQKPLQDYFYLFEVPSKFKTENTLSFLYYKYPTNWNSDNNEGVYVIRENK
jgi:hypothetical protein